jgi:predicted nucleic acid-binding protein
MIHAYWFEDNDALSQRVQHIYSIMQKRGDLLCGSDIVLSELLVGPLKKQNLAAADAIEQFFDSDTIILLPYGRRSVRVFAQLRAYQGVKSLDALHLAIAASAGVDLFLTHDRRLHKLIVPGLPFIASLDTDLF